MHFLSPLEEIDEQENLINEAESEFVLECICNSKQVCGKVGSRILPCLCIGKQNPQAASGGAV